MVMADFLGAECHWIAVMVDRRGLGFDCLGLQKGCVTITWDTFCKYPYGLLASRWSSLFELLGI